MRKKNRQMSFHSEKINMHFLKQKKITTEQLFFCQTGFLTTKIEDNNIGAIAK